MSNINRDYLIILDVKNGEVDSPNIYYFNTDKNTSNLYVQMVIKETSIEAAPIDNANNYSIKANILKPNMVGKIVEGDLVNEAKAIYEFKLPADCTDFSGNAKIEFEVYCTVDGVEEIATSFSTKFKVHGSILTEQNKYIEDSSDYPILKELMAEVKVINETARELDTAIRTLQTDMIEANNEMKANESERQSNEVLRQRNESNRIVAEESRSRNEFQRETNEDTRIANEQQRIINEDKRKLDENTRNSNENYRIENEANRVTSENNRAVAENTRVNNEEIRQTNEANREVAEQIRRTNEEARITAETARVTEHEQMRTELNEVKAENAVLMENDKKIADRMTQVEISDKRQYVIMEGLMNSAGDGYLKIEDTGNDTTLYNSTEGFVDVKNITGNTMVNSIKNPDDEFTLNADINTAGQSVTLTTAVDNGQVDVLAEGNTMVNVCDQKDPVAITTDTNTFPLRYLYTSTEYTLQFESDTAVTIDITLGGYTLSSQNIVIGLNKINIITPNELTDNNLILNGTGFSASNIVVTEATDKDFGYFQGMKSVGELEENTIEIVSANGTDSTAEGYLSNSKQILLNDPLRAVGDTKDRFIQIDGKWYVDRNCAERNYETDDETNTSYKTDKIKTVYTLASPTYEPVEISPTVNTYTDVTHITNNSTIPMNMHIVNSGYELIAKPSTKYTVVGIDNGRIGDSTIVNGTITTPATITDNFLRPYGTGKTSKVILLEGEPANIPGYFEGIKSVFEDMKITDEADENFGKYAVEVKVVGKNLFNKESSSSSADTGYIKVTPNTTYYIMANRMPNGAMAWLKEYDSNGNITQSTIWGDNFTTKSNTVKINLIGGGSFVDELMLSLIEITEYEPYQETKQTLYLDEPLYNTNNITIYNDKLGYWKNWDKVVLDGSGNVDNTTSWGASSNKTIEYRISGMLDNREGQIMCDKFAVAPVSNLWLADVEGIQPFTKDSVDIRVNKARLGTLTMKQYLSQNPIAVVYQLKEPEFISLIDNCPNWVIGSWDNCSIHFDSIIPLSATRYRYTGNVPSVVAMSEDVATNSAVSDEQDSMIVDLATQVAVLEMMTL